MTTTIRTAATTESGDAGASARVQCAHPAARAHPARSTTAGSSAPAHQRGFTIIELMITLAMVAIIAAVAMPNYMENVTRGKIVEATSNLSDMRVRLEQYFADNRAYPNACAAYAGGTPPAGTVYLPASSKYFTVTCALTATSYTITAAGNASHGMGSFAYTVDEANNRRTTSLPSGWSGAGASSTCWVIRRNGSC